MLALGWDGVNGNGETGFASAHPLFLLEPMDTSRFLFAFFGNVLLFTTFYIPARICQRLLQPLERDAPLRDLAVRAHQGDRRNSAHLPRGERGGDRPHLSLFLRKLRTNPN